mmetsp:Transcript_22192/g.77796  ORF Transcript_22192/g.77796 Transcript_22192/m.77796 type:complete len:317 (+) Transcript_22192:237-1187(+)
MRHTRTKPSLPAVSRNGSPSGAAAGTNCTHHSPCACAAMEQRHAPPSESDHSRIVLSKEDDASSSCGSTHATPVTVSECPVDRRRHHWSPSRQNGSIAPTALAPSTTSRTVARSKAQMVWSSPQDTTKSRPVNAPRVRPYTHRRSSCSSVGASGQCARHRHSEHAAAAARALATSPATRGATRDATLTPRTTPSKHAASRIIPSTSIRRMILQNPADATRMVPAHAQVSPSRIHTLTVPSHMSPAVSITERASSSVTSHARTWRTQSSCASLGGGISANNSCSAGRPSARRVRHTSTRPSAPPLIRYRPHGVNARA